MARYSSTRLKSKWVKTKWLIKHRNLSKYVPRTMLFNRKNLKSMLSSYSTIYFKPSDGTCGVDIIRIKRQARGYQTQLNSTKSHLSTVVGLYQKLHRFFSKGRSFLLQQGIQLARTDGKPFDTRVMVQKTNKGRWVSTAIITKIGKPKKVTTNYHQGGKLGYFHTTMSKSGFKDALIKRRERTLKRLGVTIGQNFDRHKKGIQGAGCGRGFG